MQTKTVAKTKVCPKVQRGGGILLLLGVLAVSFFAACSQESDPDPAYCGTWAPTDDLITYLNNALSSAAQQQTAAVETYSESSGIELSASSLSLTISSNKTVSISVLSGQITIPGTYEYEGSDSAGTFKFTLGYDSLGSAATMAQLIGSAFTENDITYTTGSLSTTLNNSTTTIFTK